MPYTLAHPAAILPIYRLAAPYTSLTALAMGSMVPDLPYFLPLAVSGGQSHSLAGVLWFCLPAGFLLWLLFHFFLKPPLLAFLPSALGTRLAALLANNKRVRGLDWRSAAVLALSLGLGALTHIGWDAFTHWNTIVVRNVEFLRLWVSLPFGPSVRVFTLLQHASSVFGLTVLALGGWISLRHVHALPAQQIGSLSQRQRGWLLAGLLLAGLIGATLAWPGVATRLEPMLFKMVVGAMDGVGLALLLACLLWHGQRQRETKAGDSQ